jgi:hypothetical protein
MLAAFGGIDVPHIQQSTRPTVWGTVNISLAMAAAKTAHTLQNLETELNAAKP